MRQTLQDLPAEGIAAGAVGGVLEVFTKPPPADLVEFSDSDGETLATPLLRPYQVGLFCAFEPMRSRLA